jgi:hypothetical protein
MQEDTKGEKPRYETESFHIRGCIYIVEIKTVHNLTNEHNVELHKMQEFNHNEPPVRPHGQTRTFSFKCIFCPCWSMSVRGCFEFGITGHFPAFPCFAAIPPSRPGRLRLLSYSKKPPSFGRFFNRKEDRYAVK